MAANHKEYERLGIVRGELNALIRRSDNSKTVQEARIARDLVKLELQRMRLKRLQHNTGAYTLLSEPEFKAELGKLKSLKEDIDALVANTGKALQVVDWLGSVLKLVA